MPNSINMDFGARTKGFTLIEVLLVMLLIGMFSATAMLSAAGLGQRSEQAAAQALISNIQQAWLWSEMNNQTTRVSFSRSHYETQVWREDAWQSPAHLRFTGQRPMNSEMDFMTSSAASTSTAIVFLAGGEYLPFSAEIDYETTRFNIMGDGLNAPELEKL